jgi:PAS domain S-box-containing protein
MKGSVIFCLFLGSLLGSNVVLAQNRKIDSLKTVLKVLRQDTNRVKTLMLLCDAQSYVDYDAIPKTANQILTLSEKLEYPQGIAKAYTFLGVYNDRTGKSYLGIDYFLKALRIYEQLQNKKLIAACYNNIGVIYLSQEDNREAYNYFDKALEVWTILNYKSGIARALNNIAIVSEREGKDSLALEYYRRSLKINEELGNHSSVSTALNSIGEIYLRRHQLEEAFAYEQRALQQAQIAGATTRYSVIYAAISEIYLAQHKHNESLLAAQRALQYAKQVNAKEDIANSYKLISQSYEADHNFERAYLYQKLYLSLNDSLQRTENKNAIERFRNNYEMEKKEKEISVLSHQHQIEVHRRNSILITLGGIVCVFFLILSRQRLSAKKKLEVERKNLELLKEQALRLESEEKYKTLIESTLLGVSIARNGQIIYANKTLLSVFGYESIESYFRKGIVRVTDRATTETRTLIESIIQNYKEGKETPQSFIGHFYDKDNKVRSFEVQAGDIMLENERCRMYVLIDVTDRLAAEKASQEMEKLFRLSQHFSNIGSWRWSFNTNNSLWSDTTYKLYGVDPSEEISSDRFYQSVHPEDRDKISVAAIVSIERNLPFEVEHRTVPEEGKPVRWIKLKGDVFRNDDGQPVEIFGVAWDITESKQIAEELRLNKEKYRLLAESGHEVLGLYDLNGIAQYMSPAIVRMFGYLPNEVVGLRLAGDRVHPMDRRQMLMNFRKAISQPDESIVMKVRMKRKDKQYIWCQKSFRAVKDDNGNITGIRCLTRDIGYEIAYEEKLNRSNARLTNSVREYKTLNRKLNYLLKELGKRSRQIESTNHKLTISQRVLKHTYEQLKLKTDALNEIAIIVLCDRNGRLTDVNEMFESVMGYDRSEIVGNTYNELQYTLYSSGMHTHEFFADIWTELVEGRGWRGEICYRAKSGSLVWCLKHMVPLTENGEFAGYFSFSYDITLDKKREAELIEAKQVAEAASVEKEDFLSVMSHEIRTPLNSVIGLSNLLLKKQPREDQMPIMKTLKYSSDNLLHLVNDILDFNKIQAGKIELEDITFNTIEFLQQFQAAYQPIASEKDLDFRVTADATIPTILSGDSMRLNQILNNLVNNAMKFTQHGQVKVKVSLVTKNENQCKLLFEVHDTGIGISEDKLPYIFQPFHQSEKYISRKFGGTGLGLSIVKSLVTMLKGEISVRSIEGEGSVFSVVVPFNIYAVAIPQHVGIKERNENALVASFKGYRILYVEDVESNRMVIESYLKDCGVECTLAADGEIALKHTANKTFDVILMDLQMPGLNGYEVTEALRLQPGGRNNHTPVIAFTAEALSENLKTRTAMYHIQDIVTKPFQLDALIRKIVKVCPKRREEEDFLSFQFYEDVFNYNPEEMEKIKTILINDFRLMEENITRYVEEENMDGIRAEIHKLSPIVKNLRCKALIRSFEEFRKYQEYSPVVKELHTELCRNNNMLYTFVENLKY